MIFKIIDLRLYAKAKEAYEEGLKETDVNKRPKGSLIDRVVEIEYEIAEEKIEARKKKDV